MGRAFEEWCRGHDQGLTDGLNKSKHGFEVGLKLGWRAALEWVKHEAISLDERGDSNRVVINRELEEAL